MNGEDAMDSQMHLIIQTARQVRDVAARLDATGRLTLAEAVTRAIYDAEKFTGVGGEGLDGRDSPIRRALGDVVDAASDALNGVQ